VRNPGAKRFWEKELEEVSENKKREKLIKFMLDCKT